MHIFREIPPTAGFPFYAKDLLPLFIKRVRKESLEEDFKAYLGVPFARITYSGTAAFYFILETLKSLSPRKTVIIPAFICPLIPLAIKRAGLKILACDINKDNFNFDLKQLEGLCRKNPDILAIVATHLAGIPLDFNLIQDIAKENRIFIIEDCAQSLGAIYKNKKAGTLGDFSFFSLCRGKGLTIYEGGVIVSKEERFAPLIEETIKRLSRKDCLSETLKIMELCGYGIFYRPLFFWFAFRLPQIFWLWQKQPLRAAGEYYTADFPLYRVSAVRMEIGHLWFRHLEEEISKQRQKAAAYSELLKGIGGLKLITGEEGSRSSYPYITLLFDEPSRRERALKAFNGSGLGVSQIYLSAIADYPYLKNLVQYQDIANARYFAERHITLTTSAFLRKTDLNRIVEKIKKI
jgi:dTDP-4-amino-4,6-dideoxygalactose transaminase